MIVQRITHNTEYRPALAVWPKNPAGNTGITPPWLIKDPATNPGIVPPWLQGKGTHTDVIGVNPVSPDVPHIM